MKDAIRQYLAHYAEFSPEACFLDGFHWSKVVVLPARREGDELVDALCSLEQAAAELGSTSKILVVSVLNDEFERREENFKCLDLLSQSGAKIEFGSQTQSCLIAKTKIDLLILDRFSNREICFQKKEGVGLARKIGCDLALQLIEGRQIDSPWIRSTDADVKVPLSYFKDPEIQASAFLFPFWHLAKSDALATYEIFLRYYVAGLRFAGSPYAYHSLGSIIGIHHRAYAEVRGFPKREAGEDFYLLNKLRKVGAIHQLNSSPIEIQDRFSNRVPFGTGPAVEKIRNTGEIRVYDFRIFELLQIWLQASEGFFDSGKLQILPTELNSASRDIFQLEKNLDSIRKRSSTADSAIRQYHIWFDAFKTLKFIHHLEREFFPSRPLKAALAESTWHLDSSSTWDEIRRFLADQECAGPHLHSGRDVVYFKPDRACYNRAVF